MLILQTLANAEIKELFLPVSRPEVAKIRQKFQILFCKMLKNKTYHEKVSCEWSHHRDLVCYIRLFFSWFTQRVKPTLSIVWYKWNKENALMTGSLSLRVYQHACKKKLDFGTVTSANGANFVISLFTLPRLSSPGIFFFFFSLVEKAFLNWPHVISKKFWFKTCQVIKDFLKNKLVRNAVWYAVSLCRTIAWATAYDSQTQNWKSIKGVIFQKKALFRGTFP